MFIVLSDIEDDGLRFDEAIGLAELELDGTEPVRTSGTRFRGSAVPDERGVELAGRLETTLNLPCSRCLERFDRELGVDFRLTLVGEGRELGGADTRVPEHEIDLYYATDGKVLLEELLREQIYLQLPLKPVCRDDCRGLCPTCGSNRNRIKCTCTDENIDPRLLPLLELKRGRTGDS